MDIEIINSNKFHTDTGYKYTKINDNCFLLTTSKNFKRYFPTKECKLFFLEKGNIEIHMPKWLYNREEDFWK